jgi:hypothetical protein
VLRIILQDLPGKDRLEGVVEEDVLLGHLLLGVLGDAKGALLDLLTKPL